jgi:cytochrome c-type biogenesis protein CcmH
VTYLALVLLGVAALAPIAFALLGQTAARTRRDSAVAIHRQQLVELDRDLAEGRIGASEHGTALLEVQRRLLAAAGTAEPESTRASRIPLLVALVAVPLLAAGLYAVDGHPSMPAAPLDARIAEADKEAKQSEQLVESLRQKLASMDPHAELTRQGYVLLGNAEDNLGHLAQAAEAWRKAVAIRFDPDLAALTAEAQTRIEGKVSADSADLFRRALAAAPADASWRTAATQRLSETAKP